MCFFLHWRSVPLVHPTSGRAAPGTMPCVAFAVVMALAPVVRADKLDALKPVGDPVRASDGETDHVAISPDGKTVAVRGLRDGAFLWDMAKQAKLCDIPDVGEFRAFSADGKFLWLTGATPAKKNVGLHMELWDVAKGESAGEFLPAVRPPDGSLTAMVSPDLRNYAYFNLTRNQLELFDTTTGKRLGEPIAQLPLSNGVFSAPSPSPSLCRMRSSGGTGQVLFFSADGNTLMTQNLNKERQAEVHLWDVATGKPIAQLDVPKNKSPGRGYLCCFSPDGKTLATLGGVRLKPGGGGQYPEATELAFFELATGKPKGSPVKVEAQTMQSLLAFSPDGKSVLAQRHFQGAGLEVEIVQYDVESGKPVQRFRLDSGATGAGTGEMPDGCVHIAAFTPDGRTLVTACKWGPNRAGKKPWPGGDKEIHVIQVWDVETGKPLTQPQRLGAFVTQVIPCPDNKTFWTATGETPHASLHIIDHKRVEAQQWQLPERKKSPGESGKNK